HDIIKASPCIEQVISLHAVYTGPEEVIVAAKVHPAEGTSIEELAKEMDDLDYQLRAASPFVADVFIDVTMYSVGSTESGGGGARLPD
ncbi:MAG TPA: hypothetical protein VLU46_16430, partial [Thermoanaerobaculia bacterium]|nr:hypothetical protein [Thermoanaerobaculia bacterium]